MVGDAKVNELFERAKAFYNKDDYIKALDVIEELSLYQGNDKGSVNYLQGIIFRELAGVSKNTDVKFTYLLASVECFSRNLSLSAFTAGALFLLAQQVESVLYYKKSAVKAKESLNLEVSLQEGEFVEKEKEQLKHIVAYAESRIAEAKTRVGSPVKRCEQQVGELKENEETSKSKSDLVQRLKLYWRVLNVEIKRNFMKVSTAELRSYVEGLFGREGLDALEEVLKHVREKMKWRLWVCRICLIKFSSPQECKNHFEEKHAADSTKYMPQRISKVWGRKISDGGWDPLDAAAAVEMIKNRLEDVKAFAYKNGWSEEWPLAADEERSKLLMEIKLLLVSFYKQKFLSCSIRDWVIHFMVKHFEKLEVSIHTLTDCHLVETPQSICFLECCELNQILKFLENIKRERDDGTDLVRRAVDSFCRSTKVKEKLDFDPQFSFLLLDKRLLQCKIARFDEEGIINVSNPNDHYAKAHAQGDEIISWLVDNSSRDDKFQFPTSIREHNLAIWVAVLSSVQFTCRTLETKYAKKLQYLDYYAALTVAKNLCISEDEKRRNVHKDQWNSYASLLCNKFKEKDAGDSSITHFFLCVVGKILKGALDPTCDVPYLEDYPTVARNCINLSDDLVLKSIDLLQLMVNNKVPRIDSKILLIEKSRIKLLNDLATLSVFDYRSYIFRPLKVFLLDRILDMESKTKAAVTEETLLFEEEMKEEKKVQSKKKENRSIKKPSTSMSSPIDKNKTVKQEPSATTPSLKTAEKDSMEPEVALSSEATKGMENMPGEDSLLAHGEATTKYHSVLDMTLKALLNINVLEKDLVQNRQRFHGNQEEQVPHALQDFFSAFLSEQITEEGLYSYLLRNVVASLDESLSSDAAEVVVAILELCHFWKRPERESLVTRLFTLEEYERMSCRKCRRKPNYPEQSSYGIVMAADSVRDLKCTFGNIKFEDILKVSRIEEKMLCDIRTGGCGKENYIHHIISRCPLIFIIVLEWEKNETEKEISETTKALDWEIDISRLYEGLEEPNTKYRVVSMIGCDEEGNYICMAYKKSRWVSLRLEALSEEVVGNWKSVVRFCGEKKVRPEILFYETVRSVA